QVRHRGPDQPGIAGDLWVAAVERERREQPEEDAVAAAHVLRVQLPGDVAADVEGRRGEAHRALARLRILEVRVDMDVVVGLLLLLTERGRLVGRVLSLREKLLGDDGVATPLGEGLRHPDQRYVTGRGAAGD